MDSTWSSRLSNNRLGVVLTRCKEEKDAFREVIFIILSSLRHLVFYPPTPFFHVLIFFLVLLFSLPIVSIVSHSLWHSWNSNTPLYSPSGPSFQTCKESHHKKPGCPLTGPSEFLLMQSLTCPFLVSCLCLLSNHLPSRFPWRAAGIGTQHLLISCILFMGRSDCYKSFRGMHWNLCPVASSSRLSLWCTQGIMQNINKPLNSAISPVLGRLFLRIRLPFHIKISLFTT